MKRISTYGLLLWFATVMLPTARAEPVTDIDPAALTSKVWQTTAVYEGEDQSRNVMERYPGVVGISIWDASSNRFEYFDPATGLSRRTQGGEGYFLITGDRRHQINAFDAGGKPLVRRLEVLNEHEFTYSRVVPRNMVDGNPNVTIRVVHTPYAGPFSIHFSERESTATP
ncbi:DUF4822 domain-containing protein [Pandoraea sputorum]|uniref:Uncharacterized protein n=1 Tax=Pandoraea sputorum TaxID=93222 RepID=A0A239SJ45_9BURK|nr:DUF4822 domain-containing protein [Pandoraea sputorum]APD12435.1 hypothetical protein NA29_16145 [Pandoraea sputorum]SNU85279.1 Uncharacterised protein [Pandoraea sputorum]VVD84275.1 hypothetical protein PSP20601_01277 [Pandoraea sputorum]VVE75146.1 hypothetical protein PSP31120_00404 [Pandoraea sputorum]